MRAISPNRRRRLARPWASVDLPAPLMPVNQTVKPLVGVPRVMTCVFSVKNSAHNTRDASQWQEICERSIHDIDQLNILLFNDFSKFEFCKIARCRVPGIESGPVYSAATHRYDQILHSGIPGLVGRRERLPLVLGRKIRPYVGVRMHDDSEMPSGFFRLAYG